MLMTYIALKLAVCKMECLDSFVLLEDLFEKNRDWIVDKRGIKHTTTNMANKMHNHT
jgi:hypothetical protein